MAHLLHIDSSFQGEGSTSRKLTARAAERWQAANPGGTVTYRDFGVDPLPHFVEATGLAARTPEDQQTPAQAATYALSKQLIHEILAADTILLGLPLYNFGPPSTVKAWVDHLIVPGLSIDYATMTGLLGGRDFFVLESRGGGYKEGTPRHGWDHAEAWLPHAFANLGLEPRFITAELTLAKSNPAMAELVDLAEQSLADAEAEIDALWAPVAA
ncbi:MAG: NAD(P)H-dependent oxidoreductase [Solirubrobacteraceae bacterium]|nr:NAD(P)H-dependent oxidoreductase [Solirubrobacteraceae bacterium]